MTYFKRAILTPIRTKIRKQEQKSIDVATKIRTKSDIKKITLEHHALEMSFSKAIVENIKRCWRDDSVDKITDSSSRGLGFNYLQSHGSLQPYLRTEYLKSSSGKI